MWQALCPNMYKINFDGAFRKDVGIGGMRVIIRDYQGLVIGASSNSIAEAADAEMAEAHAVVTALELRRDLGFSRIIVEGDAMGIISKLNSNIRDFSPTGNLIEEAKRLMTGFQSCLAQHVGRHSNKATHQLAQTGLVTREHYVWIEDCPEFLKDIVNAECNLS
ncbi:hypothetical protein PTKIN_Ptkin07bG0262500 [Pterospermum kingtungense]